MTKKRNVYPLICHKVEIDLNDYQNEVKEYIRANPDIKNGFDELPPIEYVIYLLSYLENKDLARELEFILKFKELNMETFKKIVLLLNKFCK